MARRRSRHAKARASGDDVKAEYGLTLVEILVAMVIVLVVVAASTAFVTRGRAAHRTSEAMAQIEESLDAGFTMLADEVRLAGYLGLAPPATAVAGSSALGSVERADLAVSGSCGKSLALDLASPVAAVNSGYAAAPGVPLGCRASPDGRPAPATDTLVLRHATAEAGRAQAGRLQLETNLRSAALAANGVATLGADDALARPRSGRVLRESRLDRTPDWPSLRRKRLVGGTRPAFQDEELVSGIADLQVTIGLDDPVDLDADVDRWINPGEPTRAELHGRYASNSRRKATFRSPVCPA